MFRAHRTQLARLERCKKHQAERQPLDRLSLRPALNPILANEAINDIALPMQTVTACANAGRNIPLDSSSPQMVGRAPTDLAGRIEKPDRRQIFH
jgi:hypothetical protein